MMGLVSGRRRATPTTSESVDDSGAERIAPRTQLVLASR